MAIRPTVSKQRNISALVALLSLGAWHAAPVFAASEHEILCEESHDATLEVTAYELTARPVSHDVDASETADLASSSIDVLSNDHLLKPRVDAAVRKVFTDTEMKTLPEQQPVGEPDDSVIQEPAAPPMSDRQAKPVKRQMYRRDI